MDNKSKFTSCPHCGYEAFLYEYEKRPEHKPPNWNKNGGFHGWYRCPLCGWERWERYEGNTRPVNFDPTEDEPSDQQVAVGKSLNGIYKAIKKSYPSLDTFFQDFIWDKHNVKEGDQKEIKKDLIKHAFVF